MNNIFNYIYKSLLLLLLAAFVYLLYLIYVTVEKSADNGRYQFDNGGQLILDTRTGKVTEY